MRRALGQSDSGAALITVLLLVATMSAVAVTLTFMLTNSLQRSIALGAQAQMRVYVAAAEDIAETRLTDLMAQFEGRLLASMPGLAAPIEVPIPEGRLQIRVRDYSNCFDVNQLYTPPSENRLVVAGPSMADDEDGNDGEQDLASARDDLISILQASELDPNLAEELVAGIIDWMDSDLSSQPGGAEDSYYSTLIPPYRTSGLPLEFDSELSAIRGFDPVQRDVLRSVLCAIPPHAERELRKVNINTLSIEQAARLAPIFSDELAIDELRDIIASRPVGGWVDLIDFFARPPVSALNPELIRREELGTVSSYVVISTKITYREHGRVDDILFETLPGQPVRVLRRERTS